MRNERNRTTVGEGDRSGDLQGPSENNLGVSDGSELLGRRPPPYGWADRRCVVRPCRRRPALAINATTYSGTDPKVESMKITVDFDRCQSNALCMSAAPELFEVRDDGYLYVLIEEPGEAHRERLEEAVRLCPTQAITIEG